MRTTLYLNRDLIGKLELTASDLGITTHELVALLIETVSVKNIFNIAAFQCVRYQDSDPDKKWQRLHVKFDSHVYEKGLDFRKFFKCSVSFVISFAIVHFLGEIIKKFRITTNFMNILDNYPLNYIFIAKYFKNIQGFIILWGVPEENYLKCLVP